MGNATIIGPGESGFLSNEIRLLRADTGVEVGLDALVASGVRNVPVWSLDDRMKLFQRPLTHVFANGVRETFKVRLTSGRELSVTASQPFLTVNDWQPLVNLAVGARVAVPRTVPSPLTERSLPDAKLIMLAHLLGDGSFVRHQPIRYASVDENNLAAVTAAATHFGITAVRDEYPEARCITLRLPAPYALARGRRNPIAEWLDSFELFGLRSHEKFIPDEIFSLSQQQLAVFLRHLWATDGSVTVAASGNVRIYYGTTSERMARQLCTILLRFGIVARLRPVGNTYGHPQWTVDVTGANDQARFIDEVGVHGNRSTLAAAARLRLNEMKKTGRFDTIPGEVWIRVRTVLADRAMTRNQLQLAVGTRSRGDLVDDISPSRSRLARIAEVLEDPRLKSIAASDVFWDTIGFIKSNGNSVVYGVALLGTRNFVANGILLRSC